MRLDDAEELIALIEANRGHLEPWMPWVHGYRPSSTVAFVEAAQRQARDEQGVQFAVVRTDRVAGTIGFHAVNWVNRSTSVGYWLAAPAQGEGIMTAAVRAVVRIAFDEWSLHRVELRAAPDNARSQAVAERCGFVFEGVAREAELVGGRYRDLNVYALLASD
ncbi:MAG: ribosomal-protein-serine acetyltransferase [Solirubrobacteraceae bacterium]|nr:ribosomal-protein-serine acetyltransferase [Solirubrobacteraceae bacterium]